VSIEFELKRLVGFMYARRGNEHLKEGQPNQAIMAYNEALKTIRDDSAIYSNLSAAYMVEGKFHLASKMAEEAVRLSPTNPSCVAGLAQAKLAMGEYAQAISLCESVKALCPESLHLFAITGFAHYGKASQSLRRGLLPIAVDEAKKGMMDLQASISIIPDYAHVVANIGRQLAGSGLIEQATALSELASHLDPFCVSMCELLNMIDRMNARVDFLVQRLFAMEEALRLAAARNLMAYESSLAAGSFVALTEDPCPMLREAALLYLTRFRYSSWHDMIPLLYDEEDYVRSACASLLGSSGEAYALDHLEIALQEEKSPAVKEEIRSAIKQISVDIHSKQGIQALR